MAKEFPAINTSATIQEVYDAFVIAWQQAFNEMPNQKSMALLVGHTALECGRFKACKSWNLGNIKATPGGAYDWCYYKCNEIVPVSMANSMVKNAQADGGKAYITSFSKDGKNAVIFFEPNNRYCSFRSFLTLQEGVMDHLLFIKKRYSKYPEVWQAVLDGDPVKYCAALRSHGYFTADLGLYTKGVVSLFNEFMKLPFNTDKLDLLSDDEKTNLSNLIYLANDDLIKEEMNSADSIMKSEDSSGNI